MEGRRVIAKHRRDAPLAPCRRRSLILPRDRLFIPRKKCLVTYSYATDTAEKNPLGIAPLLV